MTADLNVNVNVSHSETEEKGVLDVSSYEDLPTPAADRNGVNDANESGKGNREDDPDASYVFVAKNDTVPDEPAHSADLNGKYEPVSYGGFPDNGIEYEVTESELDHGIEHVKAAGVEGEVSSPFNNGVNSNDGKEENGVSKVPNGTAPVIGPDVLGQREVEEGQVQLISPGGLKGTGDLSEVVEPETQPELLQVKFGDVAREENSTSLNSQVMVSTDLAEAETNHSGNVDATASTESELNQSSVLEVKSSSELESNQSGNVEVTSSADVADLEKNKFDSVYTSSVDCESEPDQSNNNEDKIEGVRELNLVTDIKGNQDSLDSVTEGFKNDVDLDDQGKEPVGFFNNLPVEGAQKESDVQLEQNMEKIPCLVVTDVKLEEAEVVDNLACSNHSQSTFERNNSSEEVETLISSNAEIGESETPTSLGTETGKSSPSESDNHTIGYPANAITETVVQLKSETVHGHIPHDKVECLASDHQEGFSQTIAKSLGHAKQTTPEGDKPSEVVKMVVHHSVAIESNESIPVTIATSTVLEPEIEVGDSCPVAVNGAEINDCMKTEIVIESDNSHIVIETMPNLPANDVEPEIESDSSAIESGERLSGFPSDEDRESEVAPVAGKCVGSNSVSVDDRGREAYMHDSVGNPAGVDAGPEVENTPMAFGEVVPSGDPCASECDGLNGSSERTINCIQNDENKGNQLLTIDGDRKTPQEMEDTDKINRKEASTSSPEGSSVDASDGQNAAVEVGKKPFYYMIRIPRYDDENLKEQIEHAQFQVDEKTKSRDVIQAEIQRQRVICKDYAACVDATISKEVAARSLHKDKRKEIDSAVSLINKVKNAFYVEDIDGKIRNMEHMIQHETLPLKEEKSYIREIRQLKQIREHLSSSLGSHEDIQETIRQKDQVEEHLKLLRKEADQLRENVHKAEAAIRNAEKAYQDENAKLNGLVAKFNAADGIRQKTYAHLQSLRKRSYDKNKYFRKYRDDSEMAYDLASKGNKEELQRHCINQVERVMDLWNNIEEFRREYIRCNMRSTVRRLRTLDGRSLGPDEKPPAIPNAVSERKAKVNIVPSIPTLEGEKAIAPAVTVKTDDKSTANFGDQDNPTVKPKKLAKHVALGNDLATVSGRNEIDEAGQKEDKQTEEEELARKAEELRKQEEAAILKEQHRLEAKEAWEKKKLKRAARDAVKAQRAAEVKEKAREKRARKKEKKKALAEEVNAVKEGELSPGIEPPIETKESETREKQMSVTKRAQKPLHLTKKTKSKSMPPRLRNRRKRRMETWMWVLIASVVLFGLFLMGNGTISLKGLGF